MREEDLKSKKKPELIAIAKTLGYRGIQAMKVAEIRDLILTHYESEKFARDDEKSQDKQSDINIESVSLIGLKRPQLINIAKEKGYAGVATMSKRDLIDLIEDKNNVSWRTLKLDKLKEYARTLDINVGNMPKPKLVAVIEEKLKADAPTNEEMKQAYEAEGYDLFEDNLDEDVYDPNLKSDDELSSDEDESSIEEKVQEPIQLSRENEEIPEYKDQVVEERLDRIRRKPIEDIVQELLDNTDKPRSTTETIRTVQKDIYRCLGLTI